MDLKITRGDTIKYVLELKTKNNVDVEISNVNSIFLTVKENFKNTEYLFQKKLSDGISLGDDKKYHITIDSEDTDNLSFGTYYYDIQINFNNNEKYTVVKGNFIVDYEVTDVRSEL